MSKIVFNKDEMCEFIEQFNPTENKYKILTSAESYYEALQYDISCKSFNLKKSRIQNMINSTNMVYGDFQKSVDYGLIYLSVLDKFLLNFVSIPRLGSLYDTQYMDFEWNMHSNLNFEKYTNSYYRDHFIHQVRNLFMVFRLIDDSYIYHDIRQALISSTRNKVSQYYNLRASEWVNSLGNNNGLKGLLDKIAAEKKEEKVQYYEDYFANYVIRASLIIACLFHDIGYPVSYYLSVKDRLINFIPAVYSIMGDNNFDFNYIYSILSETVLFQFVGKEEIYERFNKNDHGTISAILVGIFFYKTGLIHSLSVEKQTAVEFAILAIYNHTLEFKACKPEERTEYVRMQFMSNPISYMLRWCDDMQEWDREYFEIAPVSNLIFCPKCKMALRKEYMSPDSYFAGNYNILNKEIVSELHKNSGWFKNFYSYQCACNKEGEYSFTKRDDFHRRTLIRIKACDNVVIEKDDDFENGKLRIDFQYNSYKLLRLIGIQPSFIKVRRKELVALKRFLKDQDFLKDGKGYRHICIQHNLSPNPILLKMNIFKEFFEALEEMERKKACFVSFDVLDKIKGLYEDVVAKIKRSEMGYEEYKDNIDQLVKNILELCYNESLGGISYIGILEKNCEKYIALVIYQKIIAEFGVSKGESESGSFKDIFRFGDDIREELVEDAFRQIKRDSDGFGYSETDDAEIKDDKYLFAVVYNYCNPENDINCMVPICEELTYYTDLYLCEQLSYLTELIKKTDEKLLAIVEKREDESESKMNESPHS